MKITGKVIDALLDVVEVNNASGQGLYDPVNQLLLKGELKCKTIFFTKGITKHDEFKNDIKSF